MQNKNANIKKIRGAALIEYALLVGFVAAVCYVAVQRFGLTVSCKNLWSAYSIAQGSEKDAIAAQIIADGCPALGAPYDSI